MKFKVKLRRRAGNFNEAALWTVTADSVEAMYVKAAEKYPDWKVAGYHVEEVP
jgi:hypothetical protein